MKTGVVRFYNTQKGFGFIQPDEGGTDVFVNFLKAKPEGQKVLFDTEVDNRSGKTVVANRGVWRSE